MKRRTFLLGLLAILPLASEARGSRGGYRSSGRTYRPRGSGGYGGSGGGSSGGCGSRGGPGYRKANGKCASWKD